ncbi:MAG: MobA/MobL family protein, partial [Xenococcaceae cyanobacterium]
MAIYYFNASVISRSSGRSATASAAYRAAEKIQDIKTGVLHDYRKKKGVDEKFILA